MANHAFVITERILDGNEVNEVIQDINNTKFNGIFDIDYNDVIDEWWLSYGDDQSGIGFSIWVSDGFDLDGPLKDTCIEFRHQYRYNFLWWVHSVFFENLAKHFKGKLYDEGIGYYDRGPDPDKYSTYEKYFMATNGIKGTPTILGKLKMRTLNRLAIGKVPSELADALGLRF